jgi:hypothetical protein
VCQDRWLQLRANAQLVVALRTLEWCPRGSPGLDAGLAPPVQPTLRLPADAAAAEAAGVACFEAAAAPRSIGAPPGDLAAVHTLLHPNHRLLTTVFAGGAEDCC